MCYNLFISVPCHTDQQCPNNLNLINSIFGYCNVYHTQFKLFILIASIIKPLSIFLLPTLQNIHTYKTDTYDALMSPILLYLFSLKVFDKTLKCYVIAF